MEKNKNKFDLSRIVFIASLVVGIFLIGGWLAVKGIHPFRFFEDGFKDTKTLVKEQTRTRPILVLGKTHKREGVTVYDATQAYNGLTVVQGWFSDGTQLRLIDMQGNVLHRWPIDFFKIWPNPKHIIPEKNIPKTKFNYHTQGAAAFPDGSIVANLGNIGTVKLNKCGKVIWTVDRMTHHSVTPTKDGGFWIPANRDIRKISKKLFFKKVSRQYLEGTRGRYENLLLFVDANGKVQKEISVLQALRDGSFEHQLYDAVTIRKEDPTHINDIEVVTPALAQKIDGVNEGDLLVSIRQMHMLAIFDKDSGSIKWHHTGPWVRQHDPDITSEGNIVVYNNGHRPMSFNRIKGSNLIELDPTTRKTKIIYPLEGQRPFWTSIMGTHQLLPNGNRLINESQAGRLFEINPQGKIVWQYIEAYSEKYAALLESATRYAPDYFTVNNWNCK